MSALWRDLANQGLTALAGSPEEGGAREWMVVMEELGRAACPAPLPGAVLANLLLRDATPADPAWADMLRALHSGDASLACAFGSHDGDCAAGRAVLEGDVANGTLAFVEGMASASHLLVAGDGPCWLLLRRDAPGLSAVATPGLSVPALSRVTLNGAPAAVLPATAAQVQDFNLLLRLALVARALGAGERAFEMACEYAAQRKQFGQAIASFQAIQHKLANCRIALDGVRRTLDNAAGNFDAGLGDWRVFASAAYAFASPVLRQVILDVHHTFGAIGYCEEHEAPRHFRRVHGDLARHGGPMLAGEELARHLLDGGRDLPEYDLGAAGNAFRSEVREWLRRHWHGDAQARFRALPFEIRGFIQSDPAYHAKLAETGWIAAAWPREFGGQARTPRELVALSEELQRAGAPMPGMGEIQAFALMQFGTEAQKATYLPLLREGRIRFCLGYSEPGAGSDLVAMKTTAVRDGDEWVINGEKIWTSYAEHSDYLWLAARTDPDAKPKHAGISLFMVPLNTPGITLRPSENLRGNRFCNEFFDNVRVPADALVGEVNDGWRVLTSALATERLHMGAFVSQILANFNRLVAYVRTAKHADGRALCKDGAIRARLGALAAEIEVARQLNMRSVEIMETGQVPLCEAAISKVFTADLMGRLGEAALEIGGMGFTLSEDAPDAPGDGRLEQMLRLSIMMVVGGGTNEIQRTLIARRGLGLH